MDPGGHLETSLAGWWGPAGAGWLGKLDGRVRAEALAALATATSGEGGGLDAALEHARAAFVAAQELARSDEQAFAALTLARLRRLSGRPQLALHIVTRMTPLAPAAIRPWLTWEGLLAGGRSGGATEVESGTPGGRCAQALAALVGVLMTGGARARPEGESAAAREPGGAALGAHLCGLQKVASAFPFVQEEVQALACLLDPAAPAPSDEGPVARWLAGAPASVPFGLHAFAREAPIADGRAEPAAGPDETVFVLGRPGQKGRRLLRAGAGATTGVVRLFAAPGDDTAGARVDTALSVLLLAGPDGLERDLFFRTVYGFPFVADRHRGVLEVLVHRLRARAARAGRLERPEGHIALLLEKAALVSDPRAATAVTDRVLQSLIELGSPGAAEAARALGLPLRTVQAALQQLIAEGACRPVRQGRHMAYKVEDTTFTVRMASEPPGSTKAQDEG